MTWSLQSTKVIASLGLSVDVSSVMIMRTERPTATMAGAFPRFAGWGRRSRGLHRHEAFCTSCAVVSPGGNCRSSSPGRDGVRGLRPLQSSGEDLVGE